MELIKVTEENGEQLVSARDLHELLEVKKDFSDWIKVYINNSDYGFEEGLDYTIIKRLSSTSTPRPRIEYILKLETALIIARCVKYNEKAIEIIDFIQNKLGKTIEIKKIKRAEIEFGHMLEKITGFKWERQVSIEGGKYFLDFLFIDIGLVIEIDGSQHYRNIESIEHDIKRDKYLNLNGLKVYRIKWIDVCKNADYEINQMINFIENINNETGRRYDITDFKSVDNLCKCGNIIKTKKSKICNICRSINNRVVKERPKYEELLEYVSKLGYVGTGKKYNVSDSAIRKWIKNYEKYIN